MPPKLTIEVTQPNQFTVNFDKAYPKLNTWQLLVPYLSLLEIQAKAKAHHKPTKLHAAREGYQSLTVGPITFVEGEHTIHYRRRLRAGPSTIHDSDPQTIPVPSFKCEACGRNKRADSGMITVETGPTKSTSFRYMLCESCRKHGALSEIRSKGWWLRAF